MGNDQLVPIAQRLVFLPITKKPYQFLKRRHMRGLKFEGTFEVETPAHLVAELVDEKDGGTEEKLGLGRGGLSFESLAVAGGFEGKCKFGDGVVLPRIGVQFAPDVLGDWTARQSKYESVEHILFTSQTRFPGRRGMLLGIRT
jgi:hypothetical protein